MAGRLVDRVPHVDPERLVADLVPPPRFDQVRFATYLPDPGEPTQAAAVSALQAFAQRISEPDPPSGRLARWLRRTPAPPEARAGIYLDGGFGVGKTHLLASLWHSVPGPKSFCTFAELTHLAGALGFARTAEELSSRRLLCVDEFELDDPGDTVLVSTLLGRLVEAGVRLAATSNTLPGKLGEGRFAARDFLREIQALAGHFDVLRIEGEDYRHRGLPGPPPPLSDEELVERAEKSGDGGTLDDFDALLKHLASVHPTRYGPLLDGVTAVHLRGVDTVDDQAVGLRLVVLADRLYDREVPVVSSGVPLDQLFAPDLLASGYRKKYFRAVSRLIALAREAG